MTKPPAGSSLLFGALAESGKIKSRKNGSNQMEMEDVESITGSQNVQNELRGFGLHKS